jgi:hypothetical protein
MLEGRDDKCLLDVLICCLHLGTRLRRAELGDRSIEEVDMVIEVHHWVRQQMILKCDHISLLFTASHSFSSSPSGSFTIFRRLPPPRVASAYCRS